MSWEYEVGHRLQWNLPTKTFPTRDALTWLTQLSLPTIDRLEMDYLLVDLQQAQQRILDLERVIRERFRRRNRRVIRATYRCSTQVLSLGLIASYDNSMAAKIYHPLLAFIASATNSELARYVEFLKEENRILRSRIPGEVHTKPEERLRLIKLGKALGRDWAISLPSRARIKVAGNIAQ